MQYEVSLLDYVLSLALLRKFGARDRDYVEFARRVKKRMSPKHNNLVQLCIVVKDKRRYVGAVIDAYDPTHDLE